MSKHSKKNPANRLSNHLIGSTLDDLDSCDDDYSEFSERKYYYAFYFVNSIFFYILIRFFI